MFLASRPSARGAILLVAATSVLIAVGHPGRARACGSTPPPEYWGVTATDPEDGARDVALDHPLVLRIASGPSSVPPGLPGDALEVTVRDVESGVVVEGTLVSRGSGADTLAWVSGAPLAPETEYVADIRIANSQELPAGAAGVASLTTRFRTGVARLAPLEVIGEPEVRIVVRDTPILDCQRKICGTGSCRTVGTRPQGFGVVTIPAVTGGADLDGYWAEVWVTDETPYVFWPGADGPHEVGLAEWRLTAPGQPQSVELPIPAEGHPYRPCFTIRLTDRRGATIEPTPICLAPEVVWGPLGPLGIDGSATNGDASGGCATSGDAAADGPGLVLALVALVWARARRSESGRR